MGRVGACGDNAAMESFFALLQKNVLDRQRWATRDELRLAIVTWIEKTYHRRRRQRRLGRLTPIEFRDTPPGRSRGLNHPPRESTRRGGSPDRRVGAWETLLSLPGRARWRSWADSLLGRCRGARGGRRGQVGEGWCGSARRAGTRVSEVEGRRSKRCTPTAEIGNAVSSRRRLAHRRPCRRFWGRGPACGCRCSAGSSGGGGLEALDDQVDAEWTSNTATGITARPSSRV